jgi:F-type H+-transporting ATPase subunit b
MQIDWTTFALEIINFLALVWILKRFLYQPVLDTLARRRASVERTLSEAREVETRARVQQSQYESRLADWEAEKAKAKVQLEMDMAVERSRQMQALSKSLAEEKERIAAVDAHKQQEIEHQQENRAMAQAQRFAATLLARLASPVLEAQLVDLLLEDWTNLSESQFQGLRSAADGENIEAVVASAFPLQPEQQRRIAAALSARLGRQLAVHFSEDPQLLSGLRLSLGPWHLSLNLADELAGFAGAANHVDR